MFKRLFSLSNPLGIAFTAATLILTLSPEARRGTRPAVLRSSGKARRVCRMGGGHGSSDWVPHCSIGAGR